MSDPWLLFDVPYLAWRAYHTTGHLSYEGDATGVLFGVLRDILHVQDRYHSKRCVFCFDVGESKRRQIYPQYKVKGNHPLTKEDARRRKQVHDQLERLRLELLPELGYANILAADGYEADDLIARAVQTINEQIVIVSADKDLYQLLRNPRVLAINTMRTNGRGIVPEQTVATFADAYGIRPNQWVQVKAIAGCTSDKIPGVGGVGEVTACKWLLGKLKPGTVAYSKIKNGGAIIERNLKLVTLPFPGTPVFEPKEDSVTWNKWRKVLKQLGMKSLIPFGGK